MPAFIRLEKNRATLCRATEREREAESYDISHPTIYSDYSMRVVAVNNQHTKAWHCSSQGSEVDAFSISDSTMLDCNGTDEIRFLPRDLTDKTTGGCIRLATLLKKKWMIVWIAQSNARMAKSIGTVLNTIEFKHMDMTKIMSMRRKGRSVGGVLLNVDLLS